MIRSFFEVLQLREIMNHFVVEYYIFQHYFLEYLGEYIQSSFDYSQQFANLIQLFSRLYHWHGYEIRNFLLNLKHHLPARFFEIYQQVIYKRRLLFWEIFHFDKHHSKYYNHIDPYYYLAIIFIIIQIC